MANGQAFALSQKFFPAYRNLAKKRGKQKTLDRITQMLMKFLEQKHETDIREDERQAQQAQFEKRLAFEREKMLAPLEQAKAEYDRKQELYGGAASDAHAAYMQSLKAPTPAERKAFLAQAAGFAAQVEKDAKDILPFDESYLKEALKNEQAFELENLRTKNEELLKQVETTQQQQDRIQQEQASNIASRLDLESARGGGSAAASYYREVLEDEMIPKTVLQHPLVIAAVKRANIGGDESVGGDALLTPMSVSESMRAATQFENLDVPDEYRLTGDVKYVETRDKVMAAFQMERGEEDRGSAEANLAAADSALAIIEGRATVERAAKELIDKYGQSDVHFLLSTASGRASVDAKYGYGAAAKISRYLGFDQSILPETEQPFASPSVME
jgi:hypothetical protein